MQDLELPRVISFKNKGIYGPKALKQQWKFWMHIVLPSQKEYSRSRKYTEKAARKSGVMQLLIKERLKQLGKGKMEETRQKIVRS